MSDFVFYRTESGRVAKRRFRSEAEIKAILARQAEELSTSEREELEKQADAAARRRGHFTGGFAYFKRAYLNAFGRVPVLGAAVETFSEWDAKSVLLTETRLAWMAEQVEFEKEFAAQEQTDAEREATEATAKAEAKQEKVKSLAATALDKAGPILSKLAVSVGKGLLKTAAKKAFESAVEALQKRAQSGAERGPSTEELAARVETTGAAVERAESRLNAIAAEAAPVLAKWTAEISAANMKQRAPSPMCKLAKDRARWAMEELYKRAETGEASPRSVTALNTSLASAVADWKAGLAKAEAE